MDLHLLYVVEQVYSSRQHKGLLEEFLNYGISITLYNLQPGQEFQEDIKNLNINYFHLEKGKPYYLSILQLNSIVRTQNINVIHAIEFIPSFYCSFITKRRVRFIYHRRHNYTQGFVTKFMDQIAIMRSTKTIAVCNAMAKVAREEHPFFRKKIDWRVNSITQDYVPFKVDNQERLNQLDPNNFTIMLLARLDPGKGHEIALEIAEILKKRHFKYQMIFVGDGVLKESLSESIKRKGVDKEVKLLGKFNDIKPVFHKTDVLIVPSVMEAFPKTPIEGMANETPVIANAVGGIVDVIVHKENGMLVKNNNPHEFADAIIELSKNQELYRHIVHEGLQTYQKNYTISNMAAQFKNLYKDLCQ